MTREEKLDAIYKEIADKELTSWCVIILNTQDALGRNYRYTISRGDERPEDEIKAIIWHPVMFGDVFEFLGKLAEDYDLEWYRQELEDLICVREKKRKAIDDQSDICLNYVYSLLWAKIEKDAE